MVTDIKSTPRRIDRFSQLPNELLASIFDYAYSTHPPEEPISKHLLPFFDSHFYNSHFYNSVSLLFPSQIDSFLETVSSSPHKAQLVHTLSLQSVEFPLTRSSARIVSLLPLLPNLVKLHISPDNLYDPAVLISTFSSLSSIKSVTTAPMIIADFAVNLDYFAPLAALPNLSELIIEEWPTEYEQHFPDSELSFSFDHVERLEISGEGASEETVSKIVDLCPNLLHLDLFDCCIITKSFDNLNLLPVTLESLSLRTLYKLIESPVDELLRFVNLRSLYLGKTCYSESIHTNLRNLPLLENVQLGEDD